MSPARGWMLTSYADAMIEAVGLDTLTVPEGVKFFAGQVEKCPNTQRLHVQAWIRLDRPIRKPAVIRLFEGIDPDIHVEVQRGNNDQALEYVTKEDTKMSGVCQRGTVPKQGQRSDLLACKELLQNGATVDDLFKEDECFAPAVKYHRGLERAREVLQPAAPRDGVEVTALYGEPGAGKSYGVRLQEPELYVVDPPNQMSGGRLVRRIPGRACDPPG